MDALRAGESLPQSHISYAVSRFTPYGGPSSLWRSAVRRGIKKVTIFGLEITPKVLKWATPGYRFEPIMFSVRYS